MKKNFKRYCCKLFIASLHWRRDDPGALLIAPSQQTEMTNRLYRSIGTYAGRAFWVFLTSIFLSTNLFADLLFIQNKLPDDVTLSATFNNRDLANSPKTTNLFLIHPSDQLSPHSLNERQRELGFIDYQKISVKNSEDEEICSKDFSQISPGAELKISLIIDKTNCHFDITECKDCFKKF